MGRPVKLNSDLITLSTSFSKDDKFLSLYNKHGFKTYFVILETIMLIAEQDYHRLELDNNTIQILINDKSADISLNDFLKIIEDAISLNLFILQDEIFLIYPDLVDGYENLRVSRRRHQRYIKKSETANNNSQKENQEIQTNASDNHNYSVNKMNKLGQNSFDAKKEKEKRSKKEKENNNNIYNNFNKIYSSTRTRERNTGASPVRGFFYKKIDDKNFYKDEFYKPNFSEVQSFCIENDLKVEAKVFFDFYEKRNWTDKNGNPIRYWTLILRKCDKAGLTIVSENSKTKKIVNQKAKDTDTNSNSFIDKNGKFDINAFVKSKQKSQIEKSKSFDINEFVKSKQSSLRNSNLSFQKYTSVSNNVPF